MTNSKNNNRIRKKSSNKPPKSKMRKVKLREWNFSKETFSIIMMLLSVFLFIFLLSSNTGSIGNALTNGFHNIFGKLSLLFPVIFFISFFFLFRGRFKDNLREFLLLYIVILLSLGYLSKPYVRNDLSRTIENNLLKNRDSGGIVGGFISYNIINLIGTVGFNILFVIVIFLFIIALSPLTYSEFFIKSRDLSILIGKKVINFTRDKINILKDKKRQRDEIKSKEDKKSQEIIRKDEENIEVFESFNDDKKDKNKEIIIPIQKEIEKKPKKPEFSDDTEINVTSYKSKQIEIKELDESFRKEFDNYNYPSIDLLEDRKDEGNIDNEEIKQKAIAIEETLESFGIIGKVVQINIGPTVTSYELKPQRGVKVSKILNLSDDLSLSLATSGIRILAPIPGKSHVGIEVPNDTKEVVGLKEIIKSENFIKSKSKIPFAMGKSISGYPVVSAIEKMPHLLVSGATGSGKSVCINTIIMSILYKHLPEEVKLLMIDPKVVELSIYNGIPHLIMPVITDPKKASSSLFWAITEMERRYKLFQKFHVRDIEGYKNAGQSDDSMENLPYIVVIIDELADLMMTAASEVEDYIMRLAQKSRACGIHLVIATQRPTVDVITGTIKANIPSRISFAVTSQTDSRTILDASGAEKLLGKGDMLYQSSDSMKPVRIQGAFVSDKEVYDIVNFIKEETETDYDQQAIETVEEKSQVNEVDDEDDLVKEAIGVIIDENTASVSLLQRKLRIGYARAGRIIDQLEQKGVVGPYEGSKPRKVLVDRTYLEGE